MTNLIQDLLKNKYPEVPPAIGKLPNAPTQEDSEWELHKEMLDGLPVDAYEALSKEAKKRDMQSRHPYSEPTIKKFENTKHLAIVCSVFPETKFDTFLEIHTNKEHGNIYRVRYISYTRGGDKTYLRSVIEMPSSE